MFGKSLEPDDALVCSCGCSQVALLIEKKGGEWWIWWGEPGEWWRKMNIDAKDIITMRNHPDPEKVRTQFTVDALEGRLDG